MRLLAFILGRLGGYLAFGLLVGLANIRQYTVPFPVLYLLLGTLMVLYGLLHLPRWNLCRLLKERAETKAYMALLGALTGINLCPPFLLAVTTAAELGRPIAALLFFFAFFLGTNVWFIPLLSTGLIVRFEPVRLAGRVLAVLVGIWYAWLGVAAIRR